MLLLLLLMSMLPRDNPVAAFCPSPNMATLERSRSRAAGPGAGRQNYSKAKVHCLLKVVETLLPIGADMWSAVEASFSKQTPRQDVLRDADSLKKKFQSLQH